MGKCAKSQDKVMKDVVHSELSKKSAILIFWEHGNIPTLVDLLCGGVDSKCKHENLEPWKNDDYDSYYKLTYSKACKLGHGPYHFCHMSKNKFHLHIVGHVKDAASKCKQCPGSKAQYGHHGKHDNKVPPHAPNRPYGCPTPGSTQDTGVGLAKHPSK